MIKNKSFLTINNIKILLVIIVSTLLFLSSLFNPNEALGLIENYDLNFYNGDSPLFTPTYDGSNQAVHPSVIYVKDRFNGFKYWMAITPYPNGNDDYENPQILVSNDGVNFTYFKTLNSYLDIPNDVKLGGHYSDVNLCYANNQLELYFRYNPHMKNKLQPDNGTNFVYVMKSKDGLNWSKKQLVLSNSTFKEKYNYVSPTIIYDNNVYNIWFSNYSTNLYHTSTKDWINFEPVSTCNFSQKPDNISIWHHDIIKTAEGYEIIISAYEDKNSGVQNLYHSTSKDGVDFSGFKLTLKPSTGSGFDNCSLYKASLVKLSDKYLLYYSARNKNGQWHIGLAKRMGEH